MLDRLFGSKTRVRLLTLFLMRPYARFHLRGLQRETGLAMGSLQHEMANLLAAGLVCDARESNSRFYSANRQHALFADLRSIVLKTTGLGDVLRDSLRGVAGIEAAFIYGSVAKNTDDASSDIDLLVLGAPDSDELHAALNDVEGTVKREVNPAVFTRAEVARRLAESDPYLTSVFTGDKTVVIGDEDGLPGARE
jgi:predicted nucleotidyltransferase